MACGMLVGSFPFSLRLSSTTEMWQPLGGPIMLVGSEKLDYALTVNTRTGNASVIPATAT